MKPSNPIEGELAKLEEQWETFIDSEQPILRWLIPPDSYQIARAFVKVKEQFEDDNPDLFIGLASVFADPGRFAFALADELNQAVEDGLAEAEADDDAGDNPNPLRWQPPGPGRHKNGFQALMACAAAVIEAFGDYFEYLTLAVTPAEVHDPDAYAQWWTACCRIHREYGLWPDKLRLVVFDNADAPGLNAPAEAAPEQMLSLTAPLDMRGAIDGILDNADDGSPGAEFRRLLVDLNDAIGRQQSGRMETLSDKAITIAQAQQWTDMLATVYLLRAAGFLNMEHFDRALADYRHAQASAQQGEREDKPGCDKLHLQACMCEGTTLFSAGQFEAAATAYRQAAELAEAQQDKLMNLEGRRMESFCMERLKRRRQAWESANRALQVGRDMEETERHQSTLRFVGEALLRTAPDARNKDRAEQALRELLGPDWKQSPDEQAAAC